MQAHEKRIAQLGRDARRHVEDMPRKKEKKREPTKQVTTRLKNMSDEVRDALTRSIV